MNAKKLSEPVARMHPSNEHAVSVGAYCGNVGTQDWISLYREEYVLQLLLELSLLRNRCNELQKLQNERYE